MKKALFVGINYYTVPSAKLNGCINDINNMEKILISKYGYSPENIVKLHDTVGNDVNLQPTKSNILNELRKLIKSSESCSEIWFHYSGHGSQVRDTNNDESDGLDEVIVPIDYLKNGFIIDDDIFNIIKQSKCKTMLVFDSCHSETICDLQWGFGIVNGAYVRKTNNNKAITGDAQINCLSGCKDAQTSADTYNSETKQGVGAFTDTLLSCLKESNYKISLINLHKRICQVIQKKGYTQTPMLSASTYSPSYEFVPFVQPTVVQIVLPPPVTINPPAAINPPVTITQPPSEPISQQAAIIQPITTTPPITTPVKTSDPTKSNKVIVYNIMSSITNQYQQNKNNQNDKKINITQNINFSLHK